MAGNRFRYGAWRDGPDPLAPPYDVRAAVDEVGERVLEGDSLRDVLRDLVRRGPRDGRGLDLSGFTDLVAEGAIVETGDLVSAEELLGQIGTVPGLAKVLDRLGLGDAPSPGQAAAGIEFVLEGLHLTRRLAKELTDDGRTRYGS